MSLPSSQLSRQSPNGANRAIRPLVDRCAILLASSRCCSCSVRSEYPRHPLPVRGLHFRYPSLFRAHVFRSLRIVHVSLRRFRSCMAPFPTPRLPRRSRFAGFLCGTMKPLRLPPRLCLRSVRHIAKALPRVGWAFRSRRLASRLPPSPDVVPPVHPSRHSVPRTRFGSPMFPENPKVPLPCS
jgi:hypothetical protein